MHEQRLDERGLDKTQKTLDLLSQTLRNQEMLNETGQAVIGLIVDYSKTRYSTKSPSVSTLNLRSVFSKSSTNSCLSPQVYGLSCA